VTLSKLICKRRAALGLTQAEVAERAGLQHKAHLAAIEGGTRRTCSPATLLGLARALKIDHKTILESAAQKA